MEIACDSQWYTVISSESRNKACIKCSGENVLAHTAVKWTETPLMSSGNGNPMVMNRIQVNNHTVDPFNTDMIRLTTTCAGNRIFEASGILVVGVAMWIYPCCWAIQRRALHCCPLARKAKQRLVIYNLSLKCHVVELISSGGQPCVRDLRASAISGKKFSY